MKSPSLTPGFVRALFKPGITLEERKQAWAYVARTPHLVAAVEYLHATIGTESAAAEFEAAKAEYVEKLAELRSGPARPAVVMAPRTGVPGQHPRAICSFEDGSEAAPHIMDADLAKTLDVGDQVLVDMRSLAIIGRDGARPGLGETAKLERVHADGQLEVSRANGDSTTVLPVRKLRERIAAGEVKAGARLVIGTRQPVAFAALPEADKLAHHQFLDPTPAADVDIERDIGCPLPLIEHVVQHTRMFLEHVEVLRRFHRDLSVTWLLTGRPGTGKSWHIRGLKSAIYKQIAATLGVSLAQVPPRCVVLKAPQLLDKWVGSSERLIHRAFTEIEELAAKKFTDAQGREVELPLLVVFEECEALGRHRGGADGDNGVHDRILGTLLQQLDPSRPEFREHCIVVCASTNKIEFVDSALRRRLGMQTQHFGALTRREAFAAVLACQLRDIPLADGDIASLSADLGSWLFASEGQEPMAEVSYVGTAEPVPVHRRDFLTPALVNRAVQQAIGRACLRHADGLLPDGLTQREVQDALDQQVLAIVSLLTAANVSEYIDVPDGLRVNTVRRVALNRPSRHHFQRPPSIREVA